MIQFSDIGKLDQERMTAILTAVKHTISVTEAATIFELPKKETGKILSRLAAKGCLIRIKRGLYAPFRPTTDNCSLNEAWFVAEKLYSPCYIGGWSAAAHWSLTMEAFSSITVLTTQKPRIRNQVINGTSFSLRTISHDAMFGLQPVRREQVTVLVSDPSRTIIDFLIDPQLGGGITNVIDMFNQYLKSKYRDADLLYSYARKVLRGSVYKRLGYLLEHCGSGEFNIISLCKAMQTSGIIKLDPKLSGDKLITRWGLWVCA